MPRVSVVMPVLRPDAPYLRRAVDSVLAQTMADLELVIVEDPGGEPVARILADHRDPRLRCITNATRTSLVAQRNRGLAEARSDFVAWLDADDMAVPDRLARQLERLLDEPGLAVLGSAIELVDAREQALAVRCYPLAHAGIVAAMRRANPLAQGATMVRRSIVLAAGGYRFAVDHTGEDYELWSRLARSGARFANLPDVLVRYRLHGGSSKATRLRALLRSTLRVKEQYWLDEMGGLDRARMLGERALLRLPPAWVNALFLAHRRMRSSLG